MSIKRLFIESDVLHEDELRSAARIVEDLLEQQGISVDDRSEIFDLTQDYAWHEPEATWKKILEADEIYADSSLWPIIGGSYSGAPVTFDQMMQKAIEHGITGKKMIFLRPEKDMNWDWADEKLIPQVFGPGLNELYCAEWNDGYQLVPVDVTKFK